MSHIHNPNPLLHTPVEDGNYVTTGQGEDGVDALRFEGPGNDLASVYLRHDPTLFE
jgi:hypothetical protein